MVDADGKFTTFVFNASGANISPIFKKNLK
jgi:hypothetical protein